jgi:hypothetical protein
MEGRFATLSFHSALSDARTPERQWRRNSQRIGLESRTTGGSQSSSTVRMALVVSRFVASSPDGRGGYGFMVTER